MKMILQFGELVLSRAKQPKFTPSHAYENLFKSSVINFCTKDYLLTNNKLILAQLLCYPSWSMYSQLEVIRPLSFLFPILSSSMKMQFLWKNQKEKEKEKYNMPTLTCFSFSFFFFKSKFNLFILFIFMNLLNGMTLILFCNIIVICLGLWFSFKRIFAFVVNFLVSSFLVLYFLSCGILAREG